MQLKRSSSTRGLLLVAAVSLVVAACSGGGRATDQGASQDPATTQAAPSATTAADPLEGEWRNESTCQDALRALRRRQSDEEVLDNVNHGWKDVLFPWGGEPTKDDPCYGAAGTRAFVARFADGNLALCEAKTGECEVHATYERVGDHSITLNDPEGNLCPCTEPWEFEIVGDRLMIHVEPADPITVSTWEAAPWTRES